ncbi:MAG TPA: 1,4-alpha-glucan branching protein GlgB [Kofleriaceae bacterium]
MSTEPRLYERLGAHVVPGGVRFAVWAPNAAAVSVIGECNDWKPGASPLTERDGFWSGVIANCKIGQLYKYHIRGKRAGYEVAKADPFAQRHEVAPGTASIIWEPQHAWTDAAWMARRAAVSATNAPVSIYEVHLGSWKRTDGRLPTYREIAPQLAAHATALGFTHVELMPLTEHPFYGSWGYETTGYFAATSRYGAPEDLMALVDTLHAAGLAVILDWVPAHFPTDEHGLGFFDGEPLYEHPDRRLGFHPDWHTAIFDFGRPEVRSFLLASALYWLDRFHIDGLRVDGVASMLYRDYGRKPGEWIPNAKGGNEYWEAVELLQGLNAAIAREQPATVTFAEESTAWPRVTGGGGLGFSYKWDMGWMHDTLAYLERDPIHRKYHHNELTMRGLYAWSERFVLPLSHDEVVHGKHALVAKFPGDRWQQHATLRLLFAYMFSLPGKKLLFMGDEFAQEHEWNHDAALDWAAADQATQLLVGELNRLYRSEAALHDQDAVPAGFRWIDADDAANSVLTYERISAGGERIVCALNFTPIVRHNYRVGVAAPGRYRELLNTDAQTFGGSGQGNLGGVDAAPVRAHGRELSLNLTVPPLGAVFLKL